MAVILGSRGMLGSMVKRVFPNAQTYDRPILDAEESLDIELLKLNNHERIINCIGVIKPYCNDVERAIRVNALFPHSLPARTIQIATDCVFSGQKGNYVETDQHDATDVYGQTKSLGEASQIYNLRCSIIGPEKQNHLSLLDWFLGSEGEVSGFTNHLWNGITTYHFAKIVQGVIIANMKLPTIQHIVPADMVNKYQLLQIIAEEFNKKIKIKPVTAPESVNRTLSTNNAQINKHLWQLAGYKSSPTIRQMIKELAELK